MATVDDFEEDLEKAYWYFDAAKKGTGPFKNRPMPERDAFKRLIRGLFHKYSDQKTFGSAIDMKDE